MKTFFAATIATFFLLGCDSPIQNQMKEGKGDSAISLKKTKFQSSNFKAEAIWLDGPFGNIKKKNSLLVLIYNNDQLSSLPKGHTLEFYATMPGMGHPMEDAGFFEEIGTGVYINSSIRFSMPGDWKNELWVMDQNFHILDKIQWLMFF